MHSSTEDRVVVIIVVMVEAALVEIVAMFAISVPVAFRSGTAVLVICIPTVALVFSSGT